MTSRLNEFTHRQRLRRVSMPDCDIKRSRAPRQSRGLTSLAHDDLRYFAGRLSSSASSFALYTFRSASMIAAECTDTARAM
jgi:hypothetical protein